MLIKNMMDDLGDGALETEVPIPNVSPKLPRYQFSLILVSPNCLLM